MKKIKIISSLMLIVGLFATSTMGGISAMDSSKNAAPTNDDKSISETSNKILKSDNLTEILAGTYIDFDSSKNQSVDKGSNVVIKENNKVSTQKTEKKAKKKKAKDKSKLKLVGNFKITGYCACVSCCGKSNGITASGTKATAGRTIAADTSKYPFGTKLVINGHTYTVEDRGGAINGNKIDIYFASHQEALQWGVRYCDVYAEK